MTVKLLTDLAEFNPDDPDLDPAFVDALVENYFPPTDETVALISKQLAGDKVSDLVVALALKVVQARVAESKSLDNFATLSLNVYDKFDCGKISTTKQCYYRCLNAIFDAGLIDDRDKFIDLCFNQLGDKKANLFCRREVEHFLTRLLAHTSDHSSLLKLVRATLECENPWAIDGLAKVFEDADLYDVLSADETSMNALLKHFQPIRRAERNICRLTGFIIWKLSKSLGTFDEFPDPQTRVTVLSELMKHTLENGDIGRKKEVFNLLRKEVGQEVDYLVDYLEEVLLPNEICDVLLEFEPALPIPRYCSTPALIKFFSIAGKHVTDAAVFSHFIKTISSRLRRQPSDLLQEPVTSIPGAVEVFSKLVAEFVASNDLTSFNAALEIVSVFRLKDILLDVQWSEFTTVVLNKIFQDEDQFLAKSAVVYLAEYECPILLTECMRIFEARTGRDIRLALIEGVEKALRSDLPTARSVATQLLYKIDRSDDDIDVREAALAVGELLLVNDTSIEELCASFEDSVISWKSHQSAHESFLGDSKAVLDDLISTISSKTHNCTDCIAKECY